MVWHDKQKAVVFDRSISLETPIAPHRIGKKNNTRKARIFPPLVAVMPGRATTTPINAALKTTRIMIRVAGWCIDQARIPSCSRYREQPMSVPTLLLRKRPYVRNQVLHLIGLQALPVRGHFVLSAGYDGGEIGIALLLDVFGSQ